MDLRSPKLLNSISMSEYDIMLYTFYAERLHIVFSKHNRLINTRVQLPIAHGLIFTLRLTVYRVVLHIQWTREGDHYKNDALKGTDLASFSVVTRVPHHDSQFTASTYLKQVHSKSLSRLHQACAVRLYRTRKLNRQIKTKWISNLQSLLESIRRMQMIYTRLVAMTR